MDLRHEFTVPTSVDQTWAHFNDVTAVAECFPGAVVTGVEDATFTGTVKVRLGPIALVYGGSGTFVDKDEAAHRFVVEAKGKDKRGNGTAGATVTLTMSDATDAGGIGGATRVVVVTDLHVTGKPAQFGRGMMQDVSDKLLGQFVACLEERLTPGAVEPTPLPPTPDSPDQPAPVPPDQPPPIPVPPPAPSREADALDVGAAVLPVLLRSYGRPVGLALGGLVLLRLLWRRSRSA